MEQDKTRQFEELLKEYESQLRYTASSLEKNSDDANDLYQASILKAWQKFDTWVPTFKFGTWVRVIIRNTFLDKQKRLQPFTFEDIDNNAEGVESLSNTLTNGSDEDMFKELQPRIIMLKEVLYSIYCFLENIDYELDEVYDTLFKPLGYTSDDMTTELFATFDTKYKQYLIEMTKQYNEENNG